MKEIFDTITQYADAYAALEKLQRSKDSLLPVGDQKTGVIAEFYGRLYAQQQYPEAVLVYGTPSERAWDIIVRRKNQTDHKIQVKSVSAYSETSRVSIIHPGWHELYLIRIDKMLWPEGFWVLLATDADWSSDKLKGRTMPKRGAAGSGSRSFTNAADKLPALLEVLKPHNNRIYENDWGYRSNSMGKDGQRIGHYSIPIDDWASGL